MLRDKINKCQLILYTLDQISATVSANYKTEWSDTEY